MKDLFGNELSEEDSLLYFVEGVRVNFGFNVQRCLNRSGHDKKWLAEKLELFDKNFRPLIRNLDDKG